jgi:predicted 3-demethylubiquinone-9 3-methyltransferase (glyoxalase superfamily)
MPKIAPCLWFDSQGEEAATFYTSVFPNSRIIEVQRYPKTDPGVEGSVSTVSFSLDGQDYVALNGGPAFIFSEAISLQVYCQSQDEVDDY